MATPEFGFTVSSAHSDRIESRMQHNRRFWGELDMVVNSGEVSLIAVVDHKQQAPGANFLSSIPAVSYIAGRYGHVGIGNLVLNGSFHNPADLAKDAATLQLMTDGRYFMGIGAGYQREEADAYGHRWPRSGERVTRLDESLQIMKQMWGNPDDEVTFEGKTVRVNGARLAVPTFTPQDAPPVMIGGSKPRMLDVVARHADMWVTHDQPIDEYKRLSDGLAEACAAIGRDPDTITHVISNGVVVRADHDDAVVAAERIGADPRKKLVGTPDEVSTSIKQYADAGVGLFMLRNYEWPNLQTTGLLVDRVIPEARS